MICLEILFCTVWDDLLLKIWQCEIKFYLKIKIVKYHCEKWDPSAVRYTWSPPCPWDHEMWDHEILKCEIWDRVRPVHGEIYLIATLLRYKVLTLTRRILIISTLINQIKKYILNRIISRVLKKKISGRIKIIFFVLTLMDHSSIWVKFEIDSNIKTVWVLMQKYSLTHF